jgi:hypothetical protein
VRFLVFTILALSFFQLSAQLREPPIGQWREHLPYNSSIDVTAGDQKIFAATPYSLFSVDLKDKNIERFSRITGLSETGISTILFDRTNDKLVVAYSNSNLDIVYRKNVFNIPDIKRSTLIGNKNIYNIYQLGKNYYLSTGLGIIVIDGDRYEVKASWFIGNGGNPVRINGFTSDGVFFYAATEEGLKKAAISTPDPANFTNWQTISATNGLSPGPVTNVFNVQNKVILQKNDSLYAQNGNTWSFLYRDGWEIINSNVSENKVLLSERLNNAGRVIILNQDGSVSRTLAQTAPISIPRKAILYQDDPWVADQFGGLSHHTGSSFEQYKPNSPEATASGEMAVSNNVFYATAGEVNDSWNYQYNGNGIFIFKEGNWENINRFRYPALDSLLDFITIAIDKRDETIWAGSYGGGLLHVKPGPVFEIFKHNRIGPTVGDPASYRVSGLSFDNENNLWISNYGSSQPLRLRKQDGSWMSFSVPFFLTENAMSQILVDDNNYKWIVSPKGNGLIVYDHGLSLENSTDDRWKRYGAGAGNGNLPANDVLCIAKDRNGFIWAGTSDGIGVFQCADRVFSPQSCEAVLPVVQQGNFSNFLFKGEEVQSIAVDGADRKWVATRNGVWLVSPEGDKLIYRFTEDNSPLLSNEVKKISVNGKTGEVFFATLKGICSFRSTATEAGGKNAGILVFPNPVPPGYSGTVGIRGLVNDAIVKITELDGRLVYQTKSLGGQAVWDGRDYRGKRITSGVYLVLIIDESRKEKAAGKIVFISK